MMSIVPMRILIAFVLFLAISNASKSWQRPQRNDDSSVADAVKYLQELDNYYSHLSRPRTLFKRKIRTIKSWDDAYSDEYSEKELEAAIALLRLDALDRIYSRFSKPRFGKRNNDARNLIVEKDIAEDTEDDWQAISQLGER